MRSVIAFLLGLHIVLVATVPVVGQTVAQTPEGAVRFLVNTLPGITYNWTGVPNVAPYTFTVTKVEPSSDPCMFDLIELMDGAPTTPTPMDFRQVLGVSQQGTDVRLAHKLIFAKLWHIRDEALAARVAYAMEFLRQHCDPAANTGF